MKAGGKRTAALVACVLWFGPLRPAALAADEPLTPHQIAELCRADLPSPIPAKVLAAFAPVADAAARARREESALPEARSDPERLIRMGKLDQAARLHLGDIDWAGLSPQDVRYVNDLIAVTLDEADAANLSAVKAMIPADGWFGYSRYGHEAADAAFNIVQHGDLAIQRQVLPALKAFAMRGEANRDDFAKMFDRVAVREGRLQRYGTQFQCIDGRFAAYPMEDAAHVERVRSALGLTETFAQIQQRIGSQKCG